MRNKSVVMDAMLNQLEKDSQFKTMQNKILPGLKRLSLLVGSFEDTINQRHPSDSPELHVKRILRNGESLRGKINQIGSEVLSTLHNTCTALRREAMRKARLEQGADPRKSEEIRLVLRGMETSEKVKLILKGDPEVVKAVADTNPLLHGIPRETLDKVVNSMLESSAPEEMAEIKELMDFTETEKKIHNIAITSVKSATETKHIQDVLEKAKVSEDIHSDFINQLNEV